MAIGGAAGVLRPVVGALAGLGFLAGGACCAALVAGKQDSNPVSACSVLVAMLVLVLALVLVLEMLEQEEPLLAVG